MKDNRQRITFRGFLDDIIRWFMPWFWKYLLTDCKSWFHLWCRAKGHPNGMIWINMGGEEPDTHCVDCGEELG